MATKSSCFQQQQSPKLNPGDTVMVGLFLRNLKKKGEATKRYQGDDDEEPIYGFKLSNAFWNNSTTNGDFSVNESACVSSEACSIAIHPIAEKFYHVATLNLENINELMGNHKFKALYDPVEESNLCHFLLLPCDSTTEALFALQTTLDDPFPSGKMPNGTENISEAERCASKYKQMISIRRWVRSRDGDLQ